MHITVIGGGIAGLVGALTALHAGHAVTLYEQHTVGSGTSGRALGLLVPVTGLNRPVDLLQREGIARWPALAAHLSEVTQTPLETFYRDLGNGNHQLRLPHLFQLLKKAILHHGGEVHENTPYNPKTLQSYNPADRLIYAAGNANAHLASQPLSYSAGLACRMEGHLPGLVCQNNLFLAPDWDGTVLAGSLNWTLKTLPANPTGIPPEKRAELLERIAIIAPHLKPIDIWLGYRPVQAPRTPLLTEIAPHTYAVTALGKIGIGLSPMLEFHT